MSVSRLNLKQQQQKTRLPKSNLSESLIKVGEFKIESKQTRKISQFSAQWTRAQTSTRKKTCVKRIIWQFP